ISECAAAGATASDEFIELYNPTPAPIDISGWKLQYKSQTGASFSTLVTIGTGVSIAAHGFYLAAGTGYVGSVTPDVTKSSALGLSGAAGHVRVGKPALGLNKLAANGGD